MNKKYELTNETKEWYDITLYRIKALKDFNDVKAGDLGGFIEKEDNLSHDGDCWVYDNACVYGNVYVFDNARVYSNARVYDNAYVYDDARVFGNAHVCDNARVYGDAFVYGNAFVCDNACVYGNSYIYGNARVCDDIHVCGDTEIHNNISTSKNENKNDEEELMNINVNKNINDIDMFKNYDYVKIIYQILNDDVWEDCEFSASNNIHSAILYAVESMDSEITDIHRNNTDIRIYFGDNERYVLTPMNFV